MSSGALWIFRRGQTDFAVLGERRASGSSDVVKLFLTDDRETASRWLADLQGGRAPAVAPRPSVSVPPPVPAVPDPG